MIPTILGMLSVILLSASGLPQTIKIFRTRSCDDLSITSLLFIVIGLSSSTTYMYLTGITGGPLMINNVVGIIITLTNLIMVLIFRKKGKK